MNTSVSLGHFTDPTHINSWNAQFAELSAQERVERAFANMPGKFALSSSFGAQSAVSLHLVSQVYPDVPVVLLDTGYLFPETYQFVEDLTARLDLNLHVYSNPMSAARQEAVYGKRWEQGLTGLENYNRDNKVEPLGRAMEELEVGTWFTGLRRVQSQSREATPFVQFKDDRFKVAPIADWTDKDVFDYLQLHNVPYHPLWEKGYVSIGDVHTTKSIHDVEDESQLRFFGLKRECGIHD